MAEKPAKRQRLQAGGDRVPTIAEVLFQRANNIYSNFAKVLEVDDDSFYVEKRAAQPAARAAAGAFVMPGRHGVYSTEEEPHVRGEAPSKTSVDFRSELRDSSLGDIPLGQKEGIGALLQSVLRRMNVSEKDKDEIDKRIFVLNQILTPSSHSPEELAEHTIKDSDGNTHLNMDMLVEVAVAAAKQVGLPSEQLRDVILWARFFSLMQARFESEETRHNAAFFSRLKDLMKRLQSEDKEQRKEARKDLMSILSQEFQGAVLQAALMAWKATIPDDRRQQVSLSGLQERLANFKNSVQAVDLGKLVQSEAAGRAASASGFAMPGADVITPAKAAANTIRDLITLLGEARTAAGGEVPSARVRPAAFAMPHRSDSKTVTDAVTTLTESTTPDESTHTVLTQAIPLSLFTAAPAARSAAAAVLEPPTAYDTDGKTGAGLVLHDYLETATNTHWYMCGVYSAESLASSNGPPWDKHNGIAGSTFDVLDFGDRPIAMVLLADWATGLTYAKNTLKESKALLEKDIAAAYPTQEAQDRVIRLYVHLGDTYYSGTDDEVEMNFKQIFYDAFNELGDSDGAKYLFNRDTPEGRPVLENPPPKLNLVLSVSGNHEMYYKRGWAYYKLLQKLNQKYPFFIVRNNLVEFCGIDSTPAMDFDFKDAFKILTYTDQSQGRLDETQVTFFKEKLSSYASGRKRVLGLHHQMYSITGEPPSSYGRSWNFWSSAPSTIPGLNPVYDHINFRMKGDFEEAGIVEKDQTTYCIWGHEHNITLFDDVELKKQLPYSGSWPTSFKNEKYTLKARCIGNSGIPGFDYSYKPKDKLVPIFPLAKLPNGSSWKWPEATIMDKSEPKSKFRGTSFALLTTFPTVRHKESVKGGIEYFLGVATKESAYNYEFIETYYDKF